MEASVQEAHLTIGGELFTLRRFRSYKLTIALDILGGVTAQLRESMGILNAEREAYAKANTRRITRQMCMERSAALKSAAERLRTQADQDDKKDVEPIAEQTHDEANEARDQEVAALREQAKEFDSRADSWERQLQDMGDAQYVEFPGELPEDEEIIITIGEAMKMRRQFTQLIGLAIIPDEELEAAWIAENTDQVLFEFGAGQLFKMEAGEEIELIAAGRDMLEKQLRPHKGAAEKLRGLRDQVFGGTPAIAAASESQSDGQESPDGSTTDSPSSSTPSESGTDGPQSESSLPTEAASPTT